MRCVSPSFKSKQRCHNELTLVNYSGDTCHHASMLFPHPKTGETAPDNLTAEYHPERAPGCCCVNHEDLDSAYKVYVLQLLLLSSNDWVDHVN